MRWLLPIFTACGPGELVIGVDLPDDTDAPEDDTDELPEEPVAEPTHDADIQPIWDDACRGCHTPNFDFADLVLHDNAYDDLVDVSARQASLLRVEPGDPEASYLWHKLNGTHRGVGGRGERMPANRPRLSEARLLTIERWIEQGAPR